MIRTPYIRSGDMVHGANVVVFRENDKLKVSTRDGIKNQCDATDPGEVVIFLDEAYSYLNQNRNYKEKVVWSGSFEVNNYVTIPSYTILENNGKLRYANSVNAFSGDGVVRTTGSSFVDLCGSGEIDGNGRYNTSNAFDAIRFTGCNTFSISGLIVGGGLRPDGASGAGACISMSACTFGLVDRNFGYSYWTGSGINATYDFIKTWDGSKQITISNNRNNGINGYGRPFCIQLVSSSDILCIGNLLMPAADDQAGFKVHFGNNIKILSNFVNGTVGASSNTRIIAGVQLVQDVDDCSIMNNVFKYCRYGLKDPDADTCDRIRFNNNDIELSVDDSIAIGLQIGATRYSEFRGNYIRGTNAGHGGATIVSGCADILLKDTTFYGSFAYHIGNGAGAELHEVGSETISYS